MIDRTGIDDPEELDLVTLMCNLLEYSSSYPRMTGSFGFFQKIMIPILLTTILITITVSLNCRKKLNLMQWMESQERKKWLCH